jgi:D-inositol-3-phosphate glycosyltransferase
VGDPALRERLSRGAVRQAARFSWDLTAERTLEVYARARSMMREAVA